MGGGAKFCIAVLALAPWALALRPAPAGDGLPRPVLPETPYKYADRDIDLPAHIKDRQARTGNVAIRDNTPPKNMVTNDGATLGRVLFYDKRLSKNYSKSCASCHPQDKGFSDPEQFSEGFEGKRTTRHSMSLANARYYLFGEFFWDQRAKSLEEQVLMPIQDEIEMGLTLEELEQRLNATDFYGPLYEKAFGTPEITMDRTAKALAQFIRSMVTYQSKYDDALVSGSFEEFTPAERRGLSLFNGQGRCGNCHITALQILNLPQNNGLDLETSADPGVEDGRFKAPSLRNIAVTAPYMHDGRFKTLEEVVEHYNSGVKAHPDLDVMLGGKRPVKMGMSKEQVADIVAFLGTLTDEKFLTDPKFSDPFPAE